MRSGSVKKAACALAVCTSLAFGAGCATNAQTGALTGAGAGALIGGLANMHGSWGASAVLGAGIGAGVGYLIGNEQDKRNASRRSVPTAEELRPLAGTRWKVVSVTPPPETSLKSIVSHFRDDGTVVTTKTGWDGQVSRMTERYRIVGSTLILSHPDYVENADFRLRGDELIIDYGNGSSTLERVR